MDHELEETSVTSAGSESGSSNKTGHASVPTNPEDLSSMSGKQMTGAQTVSAAGVIKTKQGTISRGSHYYPFSHLPEPGPWSKNRDYRTIKQKLENRLAEHRKRRYEQLLKHSHKQSTTDICTGVEDETHLPLTENDKGRLNSKPFAGPSIQLYSSRDPARSTETCSEQWKYDLITPKTIHASPAGSSKVGGKLLKFDKISPTASDTRQQIQEHFSPDTLQLGTIKPPKMPCLVYQPTTDHSRLNPSVFFPSAALGSPPPEPTISSSAEKHPPLQTEMDEMVQDRPASVLTNQEGVTSMSSRQITAATTVSGVGVNRQKQGQVPRRSIYDFSPFSHPPDPEPRPKSRKYQQPLVDFHGEGTGWLFHLPETEHDEGRLHSQQFTGSTESSSQDFYDWRKDKDTNRSNQLGEKKLGSISHFCKGAKCDASFPRSHSSPSLSHMTSAEGQTLTRARNLPKLRLPTSYEQFSPDVNTDGENETYRFHCSRSGLYQCTVTGLLFQMEREGDVVYGTVPWDRKLLSQHHKQPAGPLFEISCEQQSVCQLHLPHCEIRSKGGVQHLLVAHVNQEGMEYIAPHKITETHVIINIFSFSAYGILKDEDSPSVPIRALVLLFYRPPVDPDPSSVLNVLLLPRNVVLRDVQRIRKKTVGDEHYIETSPHCKLRPQQDYTLSTCPEDDSVLVEPTTAEFDCEDYDNYFPSFQVNLEQTMKHIQLSLKHTSSSISVWDRRVCLQSSGLQRSCGQSALNLPPHQGMWSSFIERVSEPVLKSLVDKLFEKGVMAESERESVDKIKDKRDKARFVIDTVRKKNAISQMMEALREIDPFLSEVLLKEDTLGCSC